MSEYKAILFDMDGTVLDTLEDLRDAANYTLRTFALPEISLEQTRTYVGNGARRLLELAAPRVSAETTDELLKCFKPYYDSHSEIHTRPYDGITDAMTELREAGYRIAIVSNKPNLTVHGLAEKFFPGMLDISIGESERIRRKPAPDMVLEAAKVMGMDINECVYVGDSEVDIATARNAGMDCLSVLWGFRDREMLTKSGASVFIERPEQLPEYFRLH